MIQDRNNYVSLPSPPTPPPPPSKPFKSSSIITKSTKPYHTSNIHNAPQVHLHISSNTHLLSFRSVTDTTQGLSLYRLFSAAYHLFHSHQLCSQGSVIKVWISTSTANFGVESARLDTKGTETQHDARPQRRWYILSTLSQHAV